MAEKKTTAKKTAAKKTASTTKKLSVTLDKETYALLEEYIAEYEKKFGPLCQMDPLGDNRWEWIVEGLKNTLFITFFATLIGIGIGINGVVDTQKGTLIFAPNLGWRNVNIKHEIEEEFNKLKYFL